MAYVEQLSPEQLEAAREMIVRLVEAGGEKGVLVSNVRGRLQDKGLWPEDRQQRGQIVFTSGVQRFGDVYVLKKFVTKKRKSRADRRAQQPQSTASSGEMCFELDSGTVTIEDDTQNLTFKNVVRVIVVRGE